MFLDIDPIEPTLGLTAEEIKVVQQAWKTAVNHGEGNTPGLAAFRQIFMQMDEIRKVFGFTGFDDPNFIQHTRVFSAYLNKLILSLADAKKLDDLCDRMGRIHVHVREVDFHQAFWDCFATSIISCALDEPNLPVQIAWRKAILYIIYKMKMAYHDEMCGKSMDVRTNTPTNNNWISATEMEA